MRRIFCVLFALLACVCFAESALGQCDDSLMTQSSVTLTPDEDPLGTITSAATLNDGSYVVATVEPPAVYLYDQSGHQMAQIGQSGPGPSEYQAPSIVRTDGNRIGVWDRTSLKLIVYDRTGKKLGEWTSFSQAVSDFVLSGDTLYTYHSGGLTDGYVEAYSLETETTLFELGDSPIEHAVLMMLEGSGTLSLARDTLYYATPSRARVHAHGLQRRATTEWTIPDPSFEVGDSGFSSISEIGQNREEAVDFVSESSCFYNLNVLESSLLAVLEHGTVSYGSNRVDSFDRFLRIHRLSHDGESLGCERVDLDMRRTGTNPIVGRTERGFLASETRPDDADEGFDQVLIEWMIPPK